MGVYPLKGGSLSEGLPCEYFRVIHQMAQMPDSRAQVLAVVNELADCTLAAEIVPLPKQWRSDDYLLFWLDPRVAEAEAERRTRRAISRWYDQHCGWRTGRIPVSETESIGADVRESLKGELEVFRSRLLQEYRTGGTVTEFSPDEMALVERWL
ncbi:hypothetical protein GII32_15825 [Gordonia amarae]|nr:hypothetical protein GII32_15825 [Gordonia amarae]